MSLGPNLVPNNAYIFVGTLGASQVPNNWVNVGISNGNTAAIPPQVVVNGLTTNMDVLRETASGGFQGIQTNTLVSNMTPGNSYLVSVWVSIPSGVTPCNLSAYFPTSGNVFNMAGSGFLSGVLRDTFLFYTGTYNPSITETQFGFINPGDATSTGYNFALPSVQLIINDLMGQICV